MSLKTMSWNNPQKSPGDLKAWRLPVKPGELAGML